MVYHMGCLRFVDFLKSYVSFAEYSLFYRALLHKRPITFRSLLIVATPCSTYDDVCQKGSRSLLTLRCTIKLQVCYAEYRLFYRALLQKRPTILSILLIDSQMYDLCQKKIYIHTRDPCVCVCVCVCVCICVIRMICVSVSVSLGYTTYGVATTSRLLKIISLFCKRALQKRLYSAKETYNLKEPTKDSHPICQKGSRSLLTLRCTVCYV